MRRTCIVTGQTFVVTEAEMALRRKLGIEGEPDLHPVYRFMQLAAFWQHWNLHKRTCDRTGRSIISPFPIDSPYPVWHKDEWIAHADPPHAELDLEKELFPQLFALFRRCPIAHTMGTGNENCEYADDWWYSKNCYLCHSGYGNEDLRYCYRITGSKNCEYCVFTQDCETSLDLIRCFQCTHTRYAYNCTQCSDSAFLYDCRNCMSCFLSCNLRNKQYCFGNEQLTKQEYELRVREWDLLSRKGYERAKTAFRRMMMEHAWHRSLFVDKCEGATGNYLDSCKNITGSFFLSHGCEDCVHCLRGGIQPKDCLDSISPMDAQLLYRTCTIQDKGYDVQYSFNLIQCRNMQYSAHCFQCEHCFGCCGLKGRQYCIGNKPYGKEEYARKREEVIAAMRKTGEYGTFFPGCFAASPYAESLSGFYWPLEEKQLERFGFRKETGTPPRHPEALDVTEVPECSRDADAAVTGRVYFDPVAQRPFQIFKEDIAFSRLVGCPLPSTFYARRLQENFRMIPFNGILRTATCAKCKAGTQTSWPEAYDGRILCESCYLQTVY